MKKIVMTLFIIAIVCVAFADPPNWQQISGTEYSMVLFADAWLFDEPFINTGDNIIAAFGPGGEDDCRSIGSWQNVGNGFWYFTIVGNDNGETITFKVYDDITDTIYSCGEVITFENNITIGSIQNPFQLIIQNSYISGTITLNTQTVPAGSIEDVSVSAGGISVNPDTNGYYVISLYTGNYNVIASLNGYTTVTLSDLTLLGNQSINDANITLIDWEQISGTQYSMVLMTTASISGIPIEGGFGNIIVALGPGGTDDCRGIAVWEESSPPYWDGYWYLNIVGDIEDETISFKIFDNETEIIYDCYQTIIFDNNATIGTPSSPYNISNGASQEIDLVTNWNWISFNIHPGNTSVDSVFAQLGNAVFQIKDQTQSATYYPPNWVGGLTNILDGKAYLIKMNEGFSNFMISGFPIPTNTPISLTSGWNWVAYLPQNILSVESALSSIEENVFQVKSQNQSSTYYDPPGTWTGNLDFMVPDIGYKIFMNASDNLIYIPSDNLIQIKESEVVMRDPPNWQIITGTEFSMVLMAEVTLNYELFINDGENMVAAFGPDGEDDCRSIAAWQEPNPPYHDGFWYFTIVGNDDGDDITFKIYDEFTDTIIECNETIIFDNNATIGNPSDLYQLTSYESEINNNQIPQNAECILRIYPNPFNPSTTISFELSSEDVSDSEISIYNIKGQKIKSFSIKNELIEQGKVSVVWNGADDSNQLVSSGIYFCKLKEGNKILTKKLMLLK